MRASSDPPTEPAQWIYRPLRDIFRPLPRPKTGFMVEATEVLPVVLTFTPGEFALPLRMGVRMHGLTIRRQISDSRSIKPSLMS